MWCTGEGSLSGVEPLDEPVLTTLRRSALRARMRRVWIRHTRQCGWKSCALPRRDLGDVQDTRSHRPSCAKRIVLGSLVSVAICLSACGARTGVDLPLRDAAAEPGGRDAAPVAPFECGERSIVDVVYVFDTSGSDRDGRAATLAVVGEVLEVLATCAAVRLGVITTDVGAGGHLRYGCREMGDGARLVPLGWRGSPYVEGSTAEIASGLRVLVDRRIGCGFERPFDAMTRFVGSAQFDGFHRRGAPVVFLYIRGADDCSPHDDASFFDPRNPVLPASPDQLCYVVEQTWFVEEAAVAEILTRAAPERVGFGLIAGFQPEDLAAGAGIERLLELASDYEARGRWTAETCGALRAMVPVRTTRLAAELMRRGAAVGVGSRCSGGAGRRIGEQLVATLQSP